MRILTKAVDSMDHALMQGMFWGGVLLSSIPILLGLGIAVYVWKRYRSFRPEEPMRD